MSAPTPDAPRPTCAPRPPRPEEAEVWVFDLDNTLYPASTNLFAGVEQLIRRYVERTTGLPPDDAHQVQKQYFRDYGTTMNGLMAEYNIDPEDYLDYVHQIDYARLAANAHLARALAALDAPKYIFTNGTVAHAEAVLDRLGVAVHFDAIFDIKASDYIPKPQDHFYDTFLEAHAVEPTRAVLIEDLARNLKPAHERGMATVHVRTDNPWAMEGHNADYVHHGVDDLVGWLNKVVSRRR